MKKEIRKELERMRLNYISKTYEEVAGFGWKSFKPILINNKKFVPSAWSELMPDNRTLLVVELTKNYFLGISSVYCIGFIINTRNEIQLVDETYLMEEIGHP